MGKGIRFTCKKCKHQYSIYLGIGMAYPTVYEEILADISKGTYGSEIREIYNNTPYAAINGEQVVYICKGCGSWELGTDLSLYAPNDPDRVSKKKYGDKTVAEWGHAPYVMRSDLEEDYHLIKRFFHRCGKCGKRMHKASSAQLRRLPCPKCGQINDAQDADFILWD